MEEAVEEVVGEEEEEEEEEAIVVIIFLARLNAPIKQFALALVSKEERKTDKRAE